MGLTSVCLPLVMTMVASGRVMKTLSREDTPSIPRSWVLAVILKNESRWREEGPCFKRLFVYLFSWLVGCFQTGSHYSLD